jgi:hypothetical protein
VRRFKAPKGSGLRPINWTERQRVPDFSGNLQIIERQEVTKSVHWQSLISFPRTQNAISLTSPPCRLHHPGPPPINPRRVPSRPVDFPRCHANVPRCPAPVPRFPAISSLCPVTSRCTLSLPGRAAITNCLHPSNKVFTFFNSRPWPVLW